MKKLLLSLATAVCMSACAQKGEQKQEDGGKKVLVAYFSATGTTADAANKVAAVTGGDVYEIVPEKPYTAQDLDWTDKQSRCFVEMHDLSSRPAIKATKDDIDIYDTVYIGFPIWWNIAPTIVNTFIEAHNLKGKTVIPFATSGGSTIDNSEKELRNAYPDINWKNGKLLNGIGEDEIRQWTNI